MSYALVKISIYSFLYLCILSGVMSGHLPDYQDTRCILPVSVSASVSKVKVSGASLNETPHPYFSYWREDSNTGSLKHIVSGWNAVHVAPSEWFVYWDSVTDTRIRPGPRLTCGLRHCGATAAEASRRCASRQLCSSCLSFTFVRASRAALSTRPRAEGAHTSEFV